MSAPLSSSFDPIAFHARYRPDATACVDLASGERLSYRDFDRRVSETAGRIAGLVPDLRGERVAAVARNSAELAVLSAACERAGAVFAPLNWRLAAGEIADILKDCAPALVVAQPEFDGLVDEAVAIAKCRAPVRPLAALAGIEARGKSAGYQAGDLQATCILLYTSGTTGRAKGVIITRENALWSSLNFAAVAAVETSSVLLCDSPMFHTVGLVAITRTALHQGASVLISDRFAPGVTLERISDPGLGVTHYFVVPQMVEALMREPGIERADFSRLKALFSGGGPLPPGMVTSCLKRGVMLINAYGMSEIGSGIHMPIDPQFISQNSHTVGYPAPYLNVMLADDAGEPVKPGDVGEIWMSGPSVSPGYWNQQEATAASRAGDWFRSGDLARQQADGAYIIVDRLKDMYISGGENVYPAEVEAALRQIDGIADAAVIGVADERWGEAGCAFIQLAPGGALSAADAESAVRQATGARLARYKQPAHVLVIEAIPRTGSGKARKNLLREAFLKRKRPG